MVNGATTAGSPAGLVVRRLSAEDLSILALESETVAGHMCKVIVLGEQIGLDRLRDSIRSRLQRVPELSMRLGGVDGELCWVLDPDVDVDAHVVSYFIAKPLDEAGLRAAVAGVFEERLDRSRPLWQIDLIRQLAGGGSALIWRIHHAVADGATAMRMASGALWDEEPIADAPGASSAEQLSAHPGMQPVTHHRFEALRAAAREAPHPWLRSPFDGHVGARRSVAFARVELAGLHRVAAATGGATVNDAVLSVVAGGLRRWLELHHGQLDSVRVKVPVSLHHPSATTAPEGADPGNRDSFFCLDLPLESSDPVARLAAIQRATRVRKQGHDAQHLDALMSELAHTPRLRRFAERVLAHPRSFALNVSNVRGPREPVHVLEAPVCEFYSFAEIRELHALRIGVLSHADALTFGLVADPTLLGDVHNISRGIQAEAAALTASYGVS